MDKIQFVLTKNHVKIIKRMNVEWCDDAYSGAPAINNKRPYGNSDVILDIAEIIGLKLFKDSNDETHLSKEQEDYCTKLHRETEQALQVVLSSGSFKPGLYESEKYTNEWKRVAK